MANLREKNVISPKQQNVMQRLVCLQEIKNNLIKRCALAESLYISFHPSLLYVRSRAAHIFSGVGNRGKKNFESDSILCHGWRAGKRSG